MSGLEGLIQQVLENCPAQGRYVIATASIFVHTYMLGPAAGFFELVRQGDRRWYHYFADNRPYLLIWRDPSCGGTFVERLSAHGISFGIDMSVTTEPGTDLKLAQAYVERR